MKKSFVKFFAATLLAIAAFAASAQQTNSGNITTTILASAARTAATVTSPDFTNNQWRGIIIILNVSVATAGNYTITIQGKDPVSGNYYPILTGAAVSTVSTNVYTIYPGTTAAANVSASTVLPRIWRVSLAGAASQNLTFSVAGYLIQ